MNRLIPYSGEVYAYLLAGYTADYLIVEIAAVLAAVLFVLLGGRTPGSVARAGAVGLALLWAWIGFGFYWQTYEPLNWAGGYFGWAALAQAALIASWGGTTGSLQPQVANGPGRNLLALTVLAVAAAAGPIIRLGDGETVMAAQAFGVTPLATATATFALFLLNRKPVPFWLLPIPILLMGWEAIRAIVLWVPQDLLMLSAAALALALLVHRLVRP